jgi:hypothetical protein
LTIIHLEDSRFKSFNDAADFWRYNVGVNVIPADTKNKSTNIPWKQYQDSPIPAWRHKLWKEQGAYNGGIAIVLGRVWHNNQKEGLYLNAIDCDNSKAIDEICARNGEHISVEHLAQWTLVEEHLDDPSKMHILLYSHKPYAKKSSDKVITEIVDQLERNQTPAIEVKSIGSILFCSPSIHKDGKPYEIMGTNEPIVADDFDNHIDNICRKYSIRYLEARNSGNGKSLLPIEDLFKPDFTIFEGHNRHEAVMRTMESLIARNSGILSLEEIKPLAQQWNVKHCSPPLDDKECEKQWICATDFIAKKGPQQDEEDIDKGHHSAADLLVQLTTENTSFLFKDQYGTAHAQVRIADHDEIIRIESNKFKRFLASLFYGKNGNKVVNAEAITNAIQVIQAKAEYEGQTIPLSLRVAWYNGNIYYDLSNDKWQCVRISQEGWEEVDSTPVPMFVRFNQTPQEDPDKNFEENLFDKFLQLTNLKEDQDRILLKVYIVSLFIPDIPHAMLILHGEKGSAKSTLQTMIKLLVDPAKPTLLTIHSDRSEFIQQLAHNHIAYYDNVKNTPRWLSDEACKAVTGIGQSKRKLYTDDDEIVYEYKRCLGFNGINISLSEPDALDRSMMIELDRISKENRKVESDIMKEFMQLRPQLLGYILGILVKALQIKRTIRLSTLPRMADSALWGEAIARALGYGNLEFIQAYYENIGRQNIEAIEANPLGLAIAKFFIDNQELVGSPQEVLDTMETVAAENRININHKLWPKAANSVTKRLNQIRSNLLEGLGISVTIDRGTERNTSSIKIVKQPPEPPERPELENHAQNPFETFGGLNKSGGSEPPVDKEPPVPEAKNSAQNPSTGGSGDTGGFFHNEGGVA